MLQGWAGNHLPLLHLAFDPSCTEVLQAFGVPIFEEAGYMSTIDWTTKKLTSQEVTKIFPTEFCQVQMVALAKQQPELP